MMNELTEKLMCEGVLKTPRIIEAFRATDRKDFVLDIYRSVAYEDRPLPIDHGQTISQPSTVAFMLELLDARPGDTVLDIGAGSGWQTALLAHIVGKTGHVFAMEIIPELAAFGNENITLHIDDKRAPTIFLNRSAEKGLLEHAPFDRIIAAASAPYVPEVWKEQLSPQGRIVMPVNETIICLTKKDDGSFDEDHYEGFLFVPFITKTLGV